MKESAIKLAQILQKATKLNTLEYGGCQIAIKKAKKSMLGTIIKG